MRIGEKIRLGGARFTQVAMTGVLALGLMPLPAFAADLQPAASDFTIAEATAMNTDGYVIAAAYAAANPAPEILGLSNPQQRSDQEANQTYNFFGDPEINESPDPFLYNNHNGFTPAVYIGGRQGSPMSRLNAYDTADSTAAQNAVWELLPHIILGTGTDAIPEDEHDFYATDARAVETALGLEANSYNPIGVTYNRVSLPTMIQTMYRLAAAADEVVANDSSLSYRYEDPMDIAKDYERYILGQKGAVKQYIDAHPDEIKTIALVQSYDSDAKTYTIITDGVAEGTATTNRYLEAVQGVTVNYYDTVGEAGSTAVTAEQLKNNVDVLIIGGQASMEEGQLTDYLSKDGLLDKTFFCVNWANGSAFGTTVNSVENAQNVGRILPCVYPNVLDQSDMIAYYYDVFYHLNDGVIAQTIADRMDGVRNWDKTDSASYTNWETSDVDGYNYANVEGMLEGGIAYLNSQSDLVAYLDPTEYLAGDSAASASAVTLSDYTATYTGKAVEIPAANASVTGSQGAVNIEYYSDAACTKRIAASDVVDAGTYYAKAFVRANGSYAAASSAAATITVEAATIAAPTAKTGLAYTGKAQTGVAAGDNYTLSGTTSATDAGDYTATATAAKNYVFKGGKETADVKWSIAKATIAVPAAKTGLTYTGKALTGVAAGTGYTVKDGAATDAGTHAATLTAAKNYQFTGGKDTATVKYTIAKAASKVTLAAKKATYSGKAVAASTAKVTGSTGKVTYKYYSDKACTKSVKASAVKNAGTYYAKATVAADANYKAATSSAAKVTVAKKANTLKVKAVKATQSASAKKATTIKAAKAFKVSKNAGKGKVTYKKTSGNAKIVVASNGKVTVKKGLKAGKTYTVKVKATSKATKNYKAASKTITFKVKVK